MNRMRFSGTLPVKSTNPLVVTILALVLASCSNDDFSDLDAYISLEKAKPKGPIEPLPEMSVIEPFVFDPEGLRDPFAPLEQMEQLDNTEVASGSGIQPDLTRPKEELEAYTLDSLRMVGTVNASGGVWGLVKASDGTIYRVQVGNFMGKNFGKIIRIVDDKIEIMEMLSDKPGVWREQQQTLALTE